MTNQFKYSVIYSDQAICEEVTKQELVHILLTMATGFADPEKETVKNFEITIKGVKDGHNN